MGLFKSEQTLDSVRSGALSLPKGPDQKDIINTAYNIYERMGRAFFVFGLGTNGSLTPAFNESAFRLAAMKVLNECANEISKLTAEPPQEDALSVVQPVQSTPDAPVLVV